MSAIVPKLVAITAARESARLEHLVFSGAINSVLREGRTARVAGSVAAGFAGVLAFNALADERTEATVASRLMPVVRETAAVVPVPLEEPFLWRMALHLASVSDEYHVDGPEQIDAAAWWSFIAIGAASANLSHFRGTQIHDVYQQWVRFVEHRPWSRNRWLRAPS